MCLYNQKFFIENQRVTYGTFLLYHNSLIINKLSFVNIWPVPKKELSLCIGLKKYPNIYKKIHI
jgi:hypothetical protein